MITWVGLVTNYELYTKFATVDALLRFVKSAYGIANALWERDGGIKLSLNGVKVYTTPGSTPIVYQGNDLYSLGDWFRANVPDNPATLLFSGKCFYPGVVGWAALVGF